MCVLGLILGSEGLFRSNCSKLAQIPDYHFWSVARSVYGSAKQCLVSRHCCTHEMGTLGHWRCHMVSHGHACCSSRSDLRLRVETDSVQSV